MIKTLKICDKLNFNSYPGSSWYPDIEFDNGFSYVQENIDKALALDIINFLKEAHNLKGEIYG